MVYRGTFFFPATFKKEKLLFLGTFLWGLLFILQKTVKNLGKGIRKIFWDVKYFEIFLVSVMMQASLLISPVGTGRKLNVHKTFRRRPGRLLNVLCTFNLRPVSIGSMSFDFYVDRNLCSNCSIRFSNYFNMRILVRLIVITKLKILLRLET